MNPTLRPILTPRNAASVRSARLGFALLSLALLLVPLEARADDEPPRPNVVVIYCDDLGYGDVGAFGAKGYATPHIDRLAAEGIRFTRFYTAQPVCSASRAALLTGCYPNRVGIRGALGPQAKIGIHDDELTLGELVKPLDYATGIFGKWHLGHLPRFLPARHGFDEYFGLPYSNDMWPFHPEQVDIPVSQRARRPGYPELPLFDGTRVVIAAVTPDDQRQLTTRYTQRAVSFIQRHKDRPFLLYLAHSMPHVPLFVSDKYQDRSGAGLYGDVIAEIDWSVGQVMAALAEAGVDDRTLVVFTSDNGPWLSYGNHGGSAGPLREGKGTCWEGGVRVPMIARWPGHIPAAKTCDEPAMTIDILPTIARLTGAKLPAHRIDGLDITPLLTAEPGAKSPHDAFYFYYHDNELHAVSSGPWKLYVPHTYRTLAGRPGGRDGKPVRYEQRKIEQPELYDLVADLGETTDVAARHPDVVARLQGYVERAREDLGDSLTGREGANRRAAGSVE